MMMYTALYTAGILQVVVLSTWVTLRLPVLVLVLVFSVGPVGYLYSSITQFLYLYLYTGYRYGKAY